MKLKAMLMSGNMLRIFNNGHDDFIDVNIRADDFDITIDDQFVKLYKHVDGTYSLDYTEAVLGYPTPNLGPMDCTNCGLADTITSPETACSVCSKYP